MNKEGKKIKAELERFSSLVSKEPKGPYPPMPEIKVKSTRIPVKMQFTVIV